VKRSAGSPRWWFIPNTWLGYNCRPIRFINPVLHLILETALLLTGRINPASLKDFCCRNKKSAANHREVVCRRFDIASYQSGINS
ncbi:hypothetical protein, partial [Massilia sp. PWRC2]|uniref:hypothetical protein n=1 Tax=Massilia sp. PWRC2 TaxID=2804626 RepID=UPI003CF6C377